ncbi:MAG TPA: DUF1887 family CARF protein [Blastocatellia bacterium]|nr:DUF1887 family CARF protein [Blastocatellia bacterium]
MSKNPIPDELQVENLFLLIGANPLPDWVAARLLLREQGRLYFVHSDETLPTAQDLARYLMERPGYKKPEFVYVSNPYRAGAVYQAIKGRLDRIGQGTIGLNYTGGTKVMSAHSHRAMDQIAAGLPPVIFSYLEAATCTMRFDDNQEFPVGLAGDAKLSLQELFKLHDDFALATPAKKTNAIPVAELLIKANSDFNYHRAWRSFCERNLKYPPGRPTGKMGKRPGDIKTDADARPVALNLSGGLSPVANELTSGGGNTLGDVIDSRRWGFKDAEDLAGWLDGGWMEHYITKIITDQQNRYKVDDYGRNITGKLKRFPAINRFEIDVAAMRGYQLHVFSCYSGSDKGRAKQKLFEAVTRAQQLGGDQARAALVCCADDPDAIEREVAQSWDLKNRVRVFGQRDLLNLGHQDPRLDELHKWFDSGAR